MSAADALEGPTEEMWMLHRDELTQLYLRDGEPLSQVMSLMANKHRFFAKKNQYEKYLHRKWKLRKKTTSCVWKAIAPFVYYLEKTGRQFEVRINGERKSASTVRRETRRYVRHGAGSFLHNIEIPFKLPEGVVIRELPSCPGSEIVVDLPFFGLERYLEANLPIIQAKHVPRPTQPDHAIGDILTEDLTFNPETLHTQQVVASGSNKVSMIPDVFDTAPGLNQTLSSRSRRFFFSLTNNLAGLDTLSSDPVRMLLQQGLGEASRRLIRSISKHPDLCAVAHGLYRLSVKTGNAPLADFLLGLSIPGITTDILVDVSLKHKKTPIGIAAHAKHTDLVKVLLKHGANPNFVYGNHSVEVDGKDGVLCLLIKDCLGRHRKILNDELFALLFKHGANLSLSEFEQLLEVDQKGSSVALVLSRAAISRRELWVSPRIFYKIFRSQRHEVKLQALEVMKQVGIDINHKVDNCPSEDGEFSYKGGVIDPCCPSRHKYVYYRTKLTILDVTAYTGDFALFEILIACGARLTENTLHFAIHSEVANLIQWILDHDSDTLRDGAYWDAATAAAIHTRNPEVLELIDSQRSKTIQRFDLVCRAASYTGNWSLFRRLHQLSNTSSHVDCLFDITDSKNHLMLWQALCDSVRTGEDSLALELIDAGAHLLSVHATVSSESMPSEYCDYCPLHAAVKQRNTWLTTKLLDAGAVTVYYLSDDIVALLRDAVRWGDHAIVKGILDAGLYCSPSRDSRILQCAVANKDKVMLDMLLESGIPIDCPERYLPDDEEKQDFEKRSSVLEKAVESQDVSMVDYVLRNGVTPHNPAAMFKAFSQDSTMFQLLLNRHRLIYTKGRKGWGGDILIKSIQSRNLNLFKDMIRAGADANQMFPRMGYPHLEHIWTTRRIRCDTAEIESDAATPFSLRHHTMSMSAFAFAIAISPIAGIEFAEFLLQSELQTACRPETLASTRGTLRQTAFLVAIETAHVPMVELFIQHNADVNSPARQRTTLTPLQQAVEAGSLEMVRLLLARGADVNGAAAQKGGATALQLAAIRGNLHMTHLLLKHKADVHAAGSKVDGRTALEGAAEHGHLDTVALLLQYSGKYQPKHEREFRQAISYAKVGGFYYIVDRLEAHQVVTDEFFDFGLGEITDGTTTSMELQNSWIT